MKKTIITISREFGSGGHFIGEEVAKRMNIPYYDKDIIFQIAEKTGYSESFIQEQSEYAPSKNLFAYAFEDATAPEVLCLIRFMPLRHR